MYFGVALLIALTNNDDTEVEVKKPQKKNDDQYKSKVKPRTIWDKPEILHLTDQSFTLKWKPSSVPAYAVQTPIWFVQTTHCLYT